MNDTMVPEAPPAELRFRRRIRVGASLRELWLSRELIRSLAERDLRARYNQAFLGFAWAILTPVALMVVFTVFFQGVAKIDTGGVPYALFAYVGLVPWTFFSTSVSQGGQSLLTNTNVLTKVYCPREVFPLASVVVAAVDAVIALDRAPRPVRDLHLRAGGDHRVGTAPGADPARVHAGVRADHLDGRDLPARPQARPADPAPARHLRHTGRLPDEQDPGRRPGPVLDHQPARADHRRLPANRAVRAPSRVAPPGGPPPSPP